MCEIEITHVTGIDTPLSSIVVLGSVERCQPALEGESIKVQLSCPSETIAALDPAGEFQGIFVDANEIVFVDRTNWYALFSRNSISDCRCNGQVFARAECLSDPGCKATFEVEALRCVECPDVFLEEDIFTRRECNADGTATASFSRTVENNTANDVIVEFFPGHPEAVLDPPDQDTSFVVVRTDSRLLTVSFKYPTLSSPTPFIVIRDIQGNILGCPPVPIDIGSMPACCQDISIDEPEIEDCRVTITMDPIILPEGCEYRWEWGDGTVDSSDTSNDNFREGKRNHFFKKKKKHDPYTIRVSAICGEEDPCITSATTVVELEGCKKGGGDGEDCGFLGWRCWDWCLIGRTALFIALATSAILWLLVACFPVTKGLLPAAIGASATAATLLAIWQWQCGNDCDWRVILWQSFLVMAIISGYLFRCCSEAKISLAVNAVLFLVTFWTWYDSDKCRPTRCEVIRDLQWVFVTAAAVAFAVIDFWPFPQFGAGLPPDVAEMVDCRLWIVKIAAGILAIIFTGLEQACDD